MASSLHEGAHHGSVVVARLRFGAASTPLPEATQVYRSLATVLNRLRLPIEFTCSAIAAVSA